MSSETITEAELTDTSGFPDSPEPEKSAPDSEKEVKDAEPSEKETRDSGASEGDAPESEEGSEERKSKARKAASERIRQLAEERNREREEKKALEERIAELEKALKAPKTETASDSEDGPPDPSKYKYGALDDQYIQDMIDYKASKQINAHLTKAQQQQEEIRMRAAQEAVIQDRQAKVTEIAAKGLEIHEDFIDVVLKRGMEKEYPLELPTFEAITEAENGAEIAYELATNMAEAIKVAAMTPTQQAFWVARKDAEIESRKTSSRPTRAGAPPSNLPRGSAGRFTVAGDTEDLDAFEKEFFKKK